MKYAIFIRTPSSWQYCPPLCQSPEEARMREADIHAKVPYDVCVQEVHE